MLVGLFFVAIWFLTAALIAGIAMKFFDMFQTLYPFGMQMTGRKFSGGKNYRFGFNGKENDHEVKGEGNQQDYGMRIYDPRLGKFLSVDPITAQYPELTPYQFASNSPINSIDLDGLEKFDVVTSSFAPFDVFGFNLFGGYTGDGSSRKFGGAPFASNGDIGKYRIMGAVSFDMTNIESTLIGTGSNTTSTFVPYRWNKMHDKVSYNSPTSLEFVGTSTYNCTDNSLSFGFHIFGSDQAIYIARKGMAPNIDATVNISLKKTGMTELTVTGTVTGDRFPSNETYLRDAKGGKLMLGASGAILGDIAGPYSQLFGNPNYPMSSFNLNVQLNEDGTFKGVNLKDKYFSIADWNKQFTALEPKIGSGTSTGTSGVQYNILTTPASVNDPDVNYSDRVPYY